jgi:hypothetical protein
MFLVLNLSINTNKKKAYFQLEHVNMAHLEQHLTMAMFLRQQISTGMG